MDLKGKFISVTQFGLVLEGLNGFSSNLMDSDIDVPSEDSEHFPGIFNWF